MSETFYCSKCSRERPLAGSTVKRVQRGKGWAELRQCQSCTERIGASTAIREKRAKDEARARRDAHSFAKRTTRDLK